ncbi:hypothetical protein I4F81_004130 [Pyropia yezoensis]|uniref:Uncharacterized protein n=1 Tax=Pyropia yezoensis TaxID=2788 RepID=A0ACC3BVN7_PYRYE|nr:hypothetical protein I4F81_004130 [Neopyropia yezoensis]
MGVCRGGGGGGPPRRPPPAGREGGGVAPVDSGSEEHPGVVGVGGGRGESIPGPSRRVPAANRRWLATVWAAYAVLLGGLASRLSIKDVHGMNGWLGVAAAGVQAGLLLLLSRRVWLPAAALPTDWGLLPLPGAPGVPLPGGHAGGGGGVIPASPALAPTADGGVDWPATGRWVAWAAAKTGAYLFTVLAIPAVVCATAAGGVAALPRATPPGGVGLVGGAVAGGGLGLYATALAATLSAAKAAPPASGGGGGGGVEGQARGGGAAPSAGNNDAPPAVLLAIRCAVGAQLLSLVVGAATLPAATPPLLVGLVGGWVGGWAVAHRLAAQSVAAAAATAVTAAGWAGQGVGGGGRAPHPTTLPAPAASPPPTVGGGGGVSSGNTAAAAACSTMMSPACN